MTENNGENKQKKFPADGFIIGFSGSISSGCSTFANGLAKNKDYKYYSLSHEIRKIAEEKKKKSKR